MSPEEAQANSSPEEAAEAMNANLMTGADEKMSDQTVLEHDLSPLTARATTGEAGNIDLLMDVAVPVVAQIGATEMKIKDILKLLHGSIVELDKLAGEPVDLLVRGQPFAKGEVVVVNDSFGVRVTQILTPRKQEDTNA